jgi:hypothetical protein
MTDRYASYVKKLVHSWGVKKEEFVVYVCHIMKRVVKLDIVHSNTRKIVNGPI